MSARHRFRLTRERLLKLMILPLVIGAIWFRLQPSDMSDAEFQAVVVAEIGDHLSVFETDEAVKSFKYSDQAEQWAQLSEELALWLIFNPDASGKGMRVEVNDFERVDAFGQPRARFTAFQSSRRCADSNPGGFPCQTFNPDASGWGEALYVELVEVKGEWHIGHIEPTEPLTPWRATNTYRLCFSYERDLADCNFTDE